MLADASLDGESFTGDRFAGDGRFGGDADVADVSSQYLGDNAQRTGEPSLAALA